MRKIVYSLVFIFAAGFIFSACEKEFLDNYPTDNVSSFGVTSSTSTAMAALNGIHRTFYERRYGSQGRVGIGSWYYHIAEKADDMVFNYATWTTYVRWLNRDATNSYNRSDWLRFYDWIANANVLINGVGEDTSGSQEEKDIIIGQALLYRAFCHFNMVQMWAIRYDPAGGNSQLGIPIMLETTTEGQARATVEEVYAQINQDIDAAILLLDGKPRTNKSHLNVDIGRGLKARIALTMGNYSTAASFAVLARTTDYSLMDSATYFLGFRIGSQSNDEFMWASHLTEDQTDKWGNYGAYVSRNFSSSSIRKNPRSISSILYNTISPTDVRKLLWDPTGDHLNLPPGVVIVSSAARYPYTNQKFIAVSTGDSRVDVPHMRISEMYLIEAEAEARLGNDAAAAAALYTMAVVRDSYYTLSTNTGQALIDEIMLQRRAELWGEGFRWFDLKRLNLPLDRNGANHKGSVINNLWDVPAGDNMWTSLIPQDEMDANENMVQNPL